MKDFLIISILAMVLTAIIFDIGVQAGSHRDVNEEVKKHFEFFDGGYKQGYQDGYKDSKRGVETYDFKSFRVPFEGNATTTLK